MESRHEQRRIYSKAIAPHVKKVREMNMRAAVYSFLHLFGLNSSLSFVELFSFCYAQLCLDAVTVSRMKFRKSKLVLSLIVICICMQAYISPIVQHTLWAVYSKAYKEKINTYQYTNIN